MGRRGMVTIGIAVQAETFSNSNSSSPVPNLYTPASSSSGSTPEFSFSSKSAIFLPPSKDGAPQTLRITFTYNKETNLPEIVVNLDGQEHEDKYLALRDLCRGNVTGLNFTEVPDPEIQRTTNNFTASSPNRQDKTQDLRAYYFDKINMDSEVPICAQEIEVPSTRNEKKSENQENSPKNSEDANKNESSPVPTSEHETTKSGMEAKKENINGKSRRQKKSRGTTISPEDHRIPSPTKEIGDKSRIPVIHSSTTGFLPCEYYRQKIFQEVGGCTDFMPSSCWTPTSYSSIQKTAGQKVVNKLAAQQKQLELAAAQRKRTEFVFHEDLGFCEVLPEKIPLKKKQTRLEPLRAVPKCF